MLRCPLACLFGGLIFLCLAHADRAQADDKFFQTDSELSPTQQESKNAPHSTTSAPAPSSPPSSPAATTSATVAPWTPNAYKPLYKTQCDDELAGGAPGSRSRLDFGALQMLSFGITGQLPFYHELGALHPVVGAEASWVPWVSRRFFWLGFLAGYSHDFARRAERGFAGAEFGIGPFGLDSAVLRRIGESNQTGAPRWGMQHRFVVSVPIWHSKYEYAYACCPKAPQQLRVCACQDGLVAAPLLQPFLGLEHWWDDPGRKVRWYVGLNMKVAYGF